MAKGKGELLRLLEGQHVWVRAKFLERSMGGMSRFYMGGTYFWLTDKGVDREVAVVLRSRRKQKAGT